MSRRGVVLVTGVLAWLSMSTTGEGQARRPPPPRPAVPLVADDSEIPALERDAVPPGLGTALPRCITCDPPVWPSPVSEPWRFRLHLVADASGKVATARIVQVLAGDPLARPVGPMGDVDRSLREAPTARAGQAVLGAVRQWQLAPPAHAPMLLVIDVGVEQPESATAAASQEARPSSAQRVPLKIGAGVPPPRKLVDVPPVYPADALAARITGIVTIEAVIGISGEVTQAHVVSGVPLLDDAALAAVRQWKYTPTVVDGVPVPVIVTVKLNFSLSK